MGMRISSSTDTSTFGVLKTAEVSLNPATDKEQAAADSGDTVDFSPQALRLSGSALHDKNTSEEAGGAGGASGSDSSSKLDAMIEQIKKQLDELQKQLEQMEQQKEGATEAEQQAQETKKQALQSQIANLQSQLMSLNAQKNKQASGSSGYAASAS